ncbi:MAG: DUF1018 domain-containing protein [Chlorobiaceae bacterium]|nr:DUF1018 domain-containing protein [Chlorobiaceae bacterium]
MLNNMLIKRIKTLQRAAQIEDEDYRALLAGYGVSSCKDLDLKQAAELISFLQKVSGQDQGQGQARPPKRYADLGRRGAEWATAKQLRMLEAMWMDVTVQKSRGTAMAAYHSFLLHKFGVTSPEMVAREDVSRVRQALASMRSAQVQKRERLSCVQ